MKLRSISWPCRLGRRSVAAVEFALCAPMLLFLFLGTIEVLMLYRTEAKLNTATANYAQIVSVQEGGTIQPIPAAIPTGTPGLTDLCNGIIEGLQPFTPRGFNLAVASVTETVAASKNANVSYAEWEVDLTSANNQCSTTGKATMIGSTGANGAVALAVGNGTTTNMVQGLGDNIIIVKATLQYPGVLGLILSSAATLSQTAVARWRNASSTNVTPNTALTCTGAGCVAVTCSSSSVCM